MSFIKFFLFVLTWTMLMNSIFVSAQELTSQQIKQEMSVEGIGSGPTKQDALHDAMRKAIAKAVGMYVTTRSELNDNTYKEKIIITSDATVTNYSEIESIEHNGMWMVKIEAKILPNELSKYCPQLITQKISETDIGNLLSKRNSLKNAGETLDEIFQDYYLHILRFKKRGNLRVASNDDLTGDDIRIQVDFSISIDQKSFDKFQSRLCSLLDKIALQKEVCLVYTGKNIQQTKRNRRNQVEIPKDLGIRLWKRAGLKDTDFKMRGMDVGFIAFKNYKQNEMTYTLYLVPSKIESLISNKINYGRTNIVCSFFISNESTTWKKIFCIDELIFYLWDDNVGGMTGFNVTDRGRHFLNPLTFVNRFRIDGDRDFEVENERWCNATNGSMRISIPVEHVKHLREIYIYPLRVKNYHNEEELLKIAEETEKKFWHQK